MARPAKVVSLPELNRQFTEALRRTAIRPSIAGYEPQPHQERFHKSNAIGRLFIGGNRSGKTVGGAAEMVMQASGKSPFNQLFQPPLRCRAVGVDFINGINKIVMPEIARWCPPSMLKNGSWEDSYEKGTNTLTFTNGSFIEFMSYDQDVDKFAGTSRHLIWFDEEPPMVIFDECLLRLADARGHWMMTMTPVEEMSWTYDRLYLPGVEGTNPYIEVFEVQTSENKYVGTAEMEILTMGMSDEDKAARTEGKYIRHTGAIYSKFMSPKNFLKEDPVYSKHWEGMKKDWRHFRMMDHGFRNPTCFLFACIDQEGRIIVYDEYYQSGRLVRENAEAVLKQTEELGINVFYTVGDPSIQNTDPIKGSSVWAEYAACGIGITLGNNDVNVGINRVGAQFKRDMLFIGPRCQKLKWELNRYRWAKTINKKVAERTDQKEQPMKKDDHAVDALRYGVVSTPPLTDEVDEPVGNVLNVATALTGDRFAQAMAAAPSRDFDYELGNDW